LFYCRWG